MNRTTAFAIILFWSSFALAAPPAVRTMHAPDNGIQPQVAVDATGVVHLIYFKGDPAHGDLFYVRSTDGGSTFSSPLRINSIDGSAIAIGTIRGAHLAIGKSDRVHVAWNGSSLAEPKAAGDSTPMLYARMNDAGDAFEPQRNVIAMHPGLDGGGSIAADREGNVYVAWHAPQQKGLGETDRRVWVTRSSDDGRTFAAETQAFSDATGACGCCGMRLFADPQGTVFALYRSAGEKIHRDVYLLRSDDHAATFAGRKIAAMDVNMCVMSSAVMAPSPRGTLAAWENKSQVFWAIASKEGAGVSNPIPAPGEARGRKHPALAVSRACDVLLAWTEGTGWNKGGSIAWQAYDADAKPIPGTGGKASGLAAWSLPTAFANGDGGFTIVY